MYVIFPKLELASSSDFNSLLAAYNYPTLPRQTFNWGIGLQFRFGACLLNADAMITQQRRENEGAGTELVRQILSTNFNVPYYVYKYEYANRPGFFALYPFTGVSTNETNLYLSRPSQDQPIGSLLETPENTLQVEHFAGGINIGLGIDLVSNHDDEFSCVSVRFGYRFSPEDAYSWESSFTDIADAPSDTFNHFFLQINIGGGFNWKK